MPTKGQKRSKRQKARAAVPMVVVGGLMATKTWLCSVFVLACCVYPLRGVRGISVAGDFAGDALDGRVVGVDELAWGRSCYCLSLTVTFSV